MYENNFQTLYNKYRPKRFQDFVGHKDVVKILSNILKSKYIYPSIIFTGIRGVGKTSLSWIFAAAINCISEDRDNKPCGECVNCKSCFGIHPPDDIVEINSANHTGVDNMRVIIDDTFFAPKELKYKVFIFDEAHMLSNAAWNSLLKLLEFPPSTVKFIFCTTDVNKHKIPDTVFSRSLLLELEKISDQDLRERLKYIIKNENIEILDNGINTIIENSGGSLRDGLSLLENFTLLMKDELISLEHMEKYLRILNEKTIIKIYTECLKGDWQKAIDLWHHYYEKGYSSIDFLKKFNQLLYNLCQCKLAKEENEDYNNILENFDLPNNILIGHWEICLYGLKQINTNEDNVVKMILILITLMEDNLSFGELDKIFPGIKVL